MYISNTDEIKIEENKPTITLKEKLKPSIGLIILILIVSLTQQPYWQPFISIVAILFGIFFLLIYIKNKRENNSKHQQSKIIDFLIPSKGVSIFFLLVFLGIGYFIISISMEKSKNNKSMMKLANEIQVFCIEKQECPLSLSRIFDDIKLLKPNSGISLGDGPDNENEIEDNAASIKDAGYIVPNDKSKRTYSYKLKSSDSAIFFNYIVSSNSFALSYVAYWDVYPQTTGIIGGVNSNVIQLGICKEGETPCKAIKEHDF